ncbi:MAG: hypothetical protein LBI16_00075 [Burkholderiales bacterium]|nr:hypothetical protein [Burkholderiales bacterium]
MLDKRKGRRPVRTMIGVLTMVFFTDLPPPSSSERASVRFRYLVSPPVLVLITGQSCRA